MKLSKRTRGYCVLFFLRQSPLTFHWLVIFPLPGNNALETSDVADLRFSL